MGALERRMAEPGFWDRPEDAQRTVAALKRSKRTVDEWGERDRALTQLAELLELAEGEGDGTLLKELSGELDGIEQRVSELETRSLLSGEHDRLGALVSIHPGAGGTESQDWAQMLFRMYGRWAERNGYKTELIDLQPGDEAGIKSVTFSVLGDYAYGQLKAEAGVHRLVRISPFDANKRRHTSFASVFVYPEIEDTELELDEKEIKMDAFRSSGPGGQNVNKVSSAVRLTHIPTGIVVACQTERSQHKNRTMAMKLLRAKLYELEQEKKEKEMSSIVGEKKEITWGSQIRSYVFQPYQMVKDHRTNTEVGNISAVMDGEIDEFINAYLVQSMKSSKTN